MLKALTLYIRSIEDMQNSNKHTNKKEEKNISASFIKRICFILILISFSYFSSIVLFANSNVQQAPSPGDPNFIGPIQPQTNPSSSGGPGERTYEIFSSSNSDATSSQKAVVDYITALLESWFNSLGPLVPIVSVLMIVVGIIIALITSFSKRTRAIGTGTASFAFLVFLLWLFIPTIIKL